MVNMAIGIVLESVNHGSDMLDLSVLNFTLYLNPLCRIETRSGKYKIERKIGLEIGYENV